jgi:hypothetical protein
MQVSASSAGSELEIETSMKMVQNITSNLNRLKFFFIKKFNSLLFHSIQSKDLYFGLHLCSLYIHYLAN